jgi:hypothetical protein
MESTFTIKGKVSLEDHMKYKYIAWLDGNGPCAGRSEHLVAGNSVLFKEETKKIEFYYSGLQPDKHYISVRSDMSNLEEKLEWARTHDEEMQAMVANLQTFAREQLSRESVGCYVQGLLNEYSSLYKDSILPMEDLIKSGVQEIFPGERYREIIFPDTCQYPIFSCHRPSSRPHDDPTLLVGERGELTPACQTHVD